MSTVRVRNPYSECHLRSGLHKHSYLNKRDAKRALRRYLSEGRSGLGIYRCSDCGRWHLGHDHA